MIWSATEVDGSTRNDLCFFFRCHTTTKPHQQIQITLVVYMIFER